MINSVFEKLGFTNNQSFLQLLKMTGCFQTSLLQFKSYQEALIWLRDITQEKWLRKRGDERWDQVDTEFMIKNRFELLDLLSHLGFIEEKQPLQHCYDYALLLGALESDVEVRTDYMVELWERGNRFKKIILLGSQRPLVKEEEPLINVLGETATELDLMQAYIKIHQTAWPHDLQQLEIISIDTLMQKSRQGKAKRPNIDDAIQSLLSHDFQKRHFLAIANQPYIDYLHAVLRNQLPNDFKIETVGPKVEEDVRITTALDSFARRIYADFDRLTVK